VLSAMPTSQLFTMIDACTGCGNIAVAVAKNRANARIAATDISAAALDVARRNAARHGVENVAFVEADLFADLSGPVDVITANPPYVPEHNASGLQPEVGEHEPHVALFGGGRDGLTLVARVVAEAPRLLRPGGLLICEFGFGQEVEVEALVEASADLAFVELKRDLQGIGRTFIAKRP